MASEQPTDGTEQFADLKQQVYEFIEENGPVDHDTLMTAFDGECECCGDRNDRGEAVVEARMQLIDENRVATDVDWNYRVRNEAGGGRVD